MYFLPLTDRAEEIDTQWGEREGERVHIKSSKSKQWFNFLVNICTTDQ